MMVSPVTLFNIPLAFVGFILQKWDALFEFKEGSLL